MKHRAMIKAGPMLIAAAGGMLALALMAGPANADNAAPPPAKPPVDARCLSCHDATVFTARPIAKEEWAGILQRMVGYRQDLADLDLKALETSLSATYSPKAN